MAGGLFVQAPGRNPGKTERFAPAARLEAGDEVVGAVASQPLFEAEQRAADGRIPATLPI